MYRFMFVVIYAVYIPFARGTCESFLYDILNCYGLYDVHPITSPDSILTLCDQYYPICSAKATFLNCYKNAMASCEDKRLFNPLIMEELSVKSVLNGCCAKEAVISDGKTQCFGDLYNDIHTIIREYCFRMDILTQVAVKAVDSGNWTTYCGLLDEAQVCIKSITSPLNCTTAYNDATMHLMYASQPPYCWDNSYNFYWIDRYGINACTSNWSRCHYITMMLIFLFVMTLYFVN
ncbi:uncharacterized protein LOC134697268 [Mytilus trossulus]|uniref:uncharacterized protein LOC134697268 n=1 Tax=Mytilus trossulus TaxID=6551 RepID=UPI003003EED9